MSTEPLFRVGETVVATGGCGWLLTEGKKYVVTAYQPEVRDPTFTWPVYVTVIGDFGKPVTGHAYRFRALKEEEK